MCFYDCDWQDGIESFFLILVKLLSFVMEIVAHGHERIGDW